MKDEAVEFAREFRALVEKYGVELNVDWGWYGDLDGIQLCVDGKVAASEVSGMWQYCDGAVSFP